MKMRIKGNSLRYRLTKTDLAVLATNGYLEERSSFPGQTLVYALKVSDASGLSAAFNNDTILMYLSVEMLSELVNTNRVGFNEKTGTMDLLLEKDFVCLDNIEEDQSDQYPNPLAAKFVAGDIIE
jgi:hypothetical protein